MTLESSKNIGGVGAILMFIGVLPLFAYSGVLSLIGLIMVLVATKGFADYYKEGGIFSNALYSILAAIVGGVVAIVVAFMALVSFFSELGLSLTSIQDWNSLSSMDWSALSNIDFLMRFAGSVVLVLVIVWVFAIVTAIFARRSLGLMSAKTGVGMFGTAGLLMLIGAVIPVIGLILIWIALLILAVAFFSARAQPQPAQPATTV